MSKSKKSGLGRYEMLFIIANNYTEDEAKQIIAKTEKMIEEVKASIVYREYWGKKKLAYPIKHNHYGYYALCEFEAEKPMMIDLNRNLTLATEILRHQIISVAPLTNEERAQAKEKQIQASAKFMQEKKGEKSGKEKEGDEKKEKRTERKESTKADLKDLDEKLEGIISAKDLV
jgi:small subunit ribosomal protein S6